MPFLNSGIQIVFFYVEIFKTCFDEVIPSVKDWQGKGCACDLAGRMETCSLSPRDGILDCRLVDIGI